MRLDPDLLADFLGYALALALVIAAAEHSAARNRRPTEPASSTAPARSR